MKITFYKFSGERVLVDKTSMLTKGYDPECTLKENTSVLTPSILLGSNVTALLDPTVLFGYNYVYIPLFKRYYFVEDIIVEAKNVFRFNLSVDVLMSYKDFLFGQKALVSRNRYISREGSPAYCSDNRMPFYNVYTSHYYESEDVFPEIEDSENESWFCITLFGTIGSAPIINAIDPYYTMSRTYIFRNDRNALPQAISWISTLILSDYEKYGSFVNSLYAIPFNPKKYLLTYVDDEGVTKPYKVNSLQFGPTSVDVSAREFYIINPKINTEFRIKLPLNEYKDFPPYTDWFVDLPLKGQIKLPDEVLNDAYLNGEFLIDFTIGTGTYKLVRDIYTPPTGAKRIEYFTTSVECLCPLPINSSNAGSINRQKEAYIGSFIGSSFASFGGAASLGAAAAAASVGMPVLGAAIGLISGLASTTGGAMKLNAELKALTPSGSAKQGASIFNNLDIKNNRAAINTKVMLLEYRRYSLFEDNDEIYRDLNGYVCNKTLTLSEVYGYTEIGDIHLEIPSILTEESDMLISLLTSGVIFPPKPT